ncbi:hypothetical protein ACHAQH_008441 [Verticillium albo-atrum]
MGPIQVSPLVGPTDKSAYQSSIQDDILPEGVPIRSSGARERHRIASARSWLKQKNEVADLHAAAYSAKAYREALRQEHAQILIQVHDLNEALLKHVDCNEPAISMWLRRKREAMNTRGLRETGFDDEDNTT